MSKKKRIAVRIHESQFKKLDKLAQKATRDGDKPNLSLVVRQKLSEAGVQ